jgi:ATP/maltotriose-dependent transcriptional regulator MalT
MSGDLTWARTVLSDAIAAGDERLAAHALVQSAFLRLFTEPDVTADELLQIGERALLVFEQFGDELGLARAWRLIAQAHYLGRHAAPALEASEHALVHIRRAGDDLEETEGVEWLIIPLLWGPTPVTSAIARCERLIDECAGKPVLEVMATIALANLLGMAGRGTEALELMQRARGLLDPGEEQVWFFPRNFTLLTTVADDPIAAERELRWGYELHRRSGETHPFATLVAELAETLCAQGRDDEAERLTREAEAAARPNDVQAQMLWRATRAKVHARRGEFAAAEVLAREAVAFAAESDFLDIHGDALMALADVLRLAEQPSEAATVVAQAVELFEQKGNVVSAARAGSLLANVLPHPRGVGRDRPRS